MFDGFPNLCCPERWSGMNRISHLDCVRLCVDPNGRIKLRAKQKCEILSATICIDYVLRTLIDLMKENGFTLAKARSRRYPAQTITDADYSDDIALLAPTQAKSLPYSLEQPAGGIGLHVNADKTGLYALIKGRQLHIK